MADETTPAHHMTFGELTALIKDLRAERDAACAERDNWRVTADLMYAHYHDDNGTELVAVYEQAVRDAR